jgi:hypothetical protein
MPELKTVYLTNIGSKMSAASNTSIYLGRKRAHPSLDRVVRLWEEQGQGMQSFFYESFGEYAADGVVSLKLSETMISVLYLSQ